MRDKEGQKGNVNERHMYSLMEKGVCRKDNGRVSENVKVRSKVGKFSDSIKYRVRQTKMSESEGSMQTRIFL